MCEILNIDLVRKTILIPAPPQGGNPMPKFSKKILESVSTTELKRLVVVKGKIEKLEAQKKKLETALAKVEKELAKLWGGGAVAKPKKKAARKKVARKKVARKKNARKAAPKKKVATKRAAAPKKKVVAKKVGKKKSRKAPVKWAAKAPTATLEDVVAKVIKAGGKKMAFQDIKKTIQSKKLFKTKSKNFDNVLRRTISTAKTIKRAGRGVYTVK
jgi:adenylate kinase